MTALALSSLFAAAPALASVHRQGRSPKTVRPVAGEAGKETKSEGGSAESGKTEEKAPKKRVKKGSKSAAEKPAEATPPAAAPATK
jgi:hypothetical protein